MSAKKLPKCTPDAENKTQASATLYQGINCNDSNPANVTKRWSGKKVNQLGSSIFLPSFFRST